jgi:hypothetical protein
MSGSSSPFDASASAWVRPKTYNGTSTALRRSPNPMATRLGI